jgi:hypothetical protein
MTTRKTTGLGLSFIAILMLCAPARGADRLTLSSTNPTALEIDQIPKRKHWEAFVDPSFPTIK